MRHKNIAREISLIPLEKLSKLVLTRQAVFSIVEMTLFPRLQAGQELLMSPKRVYKIKNENVNLPT